MLEYCAFIGKNEMSLNDTTVRKMMTDWLHVNVSGGPFEITGWCLNEGEDGIEFDFIPVVKLEKS